MRVIIIEDEHTAAEHLISLLRNVEETITIEAVLQTVSESVNWIENNPTPQLAFMDIQLADVNSFEIFKKTEINFPVIFTTAYDEFILKAFEVNSVDYLLKPINEKRLRKALDKVKKLESHFVNHKLIELIEKNTNQGASKRFIVKKGLDYISIKEENVAYFFTEHKLSFLIDHEGRKYIIDKTISILSDELNPLKFFRANRKYLVNIDAIEKFKSDNGKIILTLHPKNFEEVVVSKENAPNFRRWIGVG